MRKYLIVIQAMILSTIAVYGAVAGADNGAYCPLPQPKASQSCDATH